MREFVSTWTKLSLASDSEIGLFTYYYYITLPQRTVIRTLTQDQSLLTIHMKETLGFVAVLETCCISVGVASNR